MKEYRLLARAEMHGAVRDPGYIFTLAEGESGPHRTVVASHHGSQIAEHIGGSQELIDEPLYEEVKYEVAKPPAPEPLVMSNRSELEGLLARFKDRSSWADETPEHDKTLVNGNLNGFVGFVCVEMGWAEPETVVAEVGSAPDPASPEDGFAATSVRIVDHR